jgi:uncharacterized protein
VVPAAPYRPKDVPAVDRSALELEGRPHRASSYTIYVDLPGHVEEMLLVHAYTGAYDKVSRRVATYLRSRESRHAPKPLYGDWSPEPMADGAALSPSADAIETLKKRGYLTQLSPEEEEAVFVDFASKVHLRTLRAPPNYILMPTYQCNLRCPYCFQDHMRTDPQNAHLLRTMDRSMADRILAGMERIEAAHGIASDTDPGRSITFFGGEPLLEASRPIVEHIIRRSIDRGHAKFAAITNGTDLHAFEDLLGPDFISRLQITIDGPPREHDQRRIYADGSGSFERIARNVTMALERGVRIDVRMNIDRSNLSLLPEIADEFVSRGWVGRRGFYAYVAPVHNAHGHEAGAKTTLTSWQLNQAIANLKSRYPNVTNIGSGDDSLTARARALISRHLDPLPGFKASFCGAHSNMYVIDAFGDMYACWEKTGDPATRIGHIAEDGTVFMKPDVMDVWRSRNVTSNPVCRKCRYAPYCGGGCAVLAEDASGHMHKNHCDGYAKRFRSSVATAYREQLAGVATGACMTSTCDT